MLNTTTQYMIRPTSTLFSQKMISWSQGLLRAVNSLQL